MRKIIRYTLTKRNNDDEKKFSAFLNDEKNFKEQKAMSKELCNILYNDCSL